MKLLNVKVDSCNNCPYLRSRTQYGPWQSEYIEYYCESTSNVLADEGDDNRFNKKYEEWLETKNTFFPTPYLSHVLDSIALTCPLPEVDDEDSRLATK